MQAPGANATDKRRRHVNLYDRLRDDLPVRARDFADVSILVRHGPRWTELHALDHPEAQPAALVDGGLFGQQFVHPDDVRCHELVSRRKASIRMLFDPPLAK
jgi:hypothetical protein